MTEVKAEIPMAELLGLRARTALTDRRAGRLHDGIFCATRRSPGHLVKKVLDATNVEAVHA